MSKITQGHWEAKGSKIRINDDVLVATANGWTDEECAANANLIAAAPEQNKTLNAIEIRGPDADGICWLLIDIGTGKAMLNLGEIRPETIVGQTIKIWREDRELALAKARGES